MQRRMMTSFIFVSLLGIYPFIMSQGYIKILWGKYIYFLFTMIIVTTCVCVEFLKKWFKDEELFSITKIKARLQSWNMIDKSVAVYFVASTISFLLCENKKMSFSGIEDMYMGYLFTCICILLYATVRTHDFNSELFLVLIYVVLVLEVLFSLMQFCGIDWFNLIAQIRDDAKINFLSTWGNTCVFGAFLIFYGTIVLYQYCKEECMRWRVLSAIGCVAFYLGVLISNTDATVLGTLVCLAVMFIYVSKEKKMFVRFMQIPFFFATGGVMLNVLFAICEGHRPLSSMGHIGMSWWVLGSFLLLGLGTQVLLHCQVIKEREILYLGKIVKVITVVAILGCIACMFYFSICDRQVYLGGLTNYLRFSENWGTGRGYIWKLVIEIYRDFSLRDKLFGLGPATVDPLLVGGYKEQMLNDIQYCFNNAHNVYLQYLLTNGAVGVVSYFSIIISLFILSIGRKINGIGMACAIALVAAFAMDVVLILQPITIPFIWIFLAISAKMGKK